MKSAVPTNVMQDRDVTYEASPMMHTKQLAEYWKVEPRTLTNWIAKVRKYGYEIGETGERNRTYFNDVDQDLIKNARHGTLTRNPNSKKAKPFSETSENSENVLSIDDQLRQRQQEEAEETEQNLNLQLRSQVIEGGSTLTLARTTAAYDEGAAIAKAEFGAKVQGYLKTKVAANAAFDQFVAELDQGAIEETEGEAQLGEFTPAGLLAGLF
ncbi:MAG: hypothetical protein ACRCZS_19280 [Chroococcidiopsis sp.]